MKKTQIRKKMYSTKKSFFNYKPYISMFYVGFLMLFTYFIGIISDNHIIKYNMFRIYRGDSVEHKSILAAFDQALFQFSVLSPEMQSVLINFLIPNLLIGSALMAIFLTFFKFVKMPKWRNPFLHVIFGGFFGIFWPCNALSGWIISSAIFLRGGSNLLSLGFGLTSSSASILYLCSFNQYSTLMICVKLLCLLLCIIVMPIFIILKYEESYYTQKSYKNLKNLILSSINLFSLSKIFVRSFVFLFLPMTVMFFSGIAINSVISNVFSPSLNFAEIIGISLLTSISQFDIVNGGIIYEMPKIYTKWTEYNLSIVGMFFNNCGFSVFSFTMIWKTFSPKSSIFILVYFTLSAFLVGIMCSF